MIPMSSTPEIDAAQIEARALELHRVRKVNTARNYPWVEPLTFDGGERAFCLAEARDILALEASAAAVIGSMAHMTDADLCRQIELLAEERSQPLYAIIVSSSRSQKSGDDLWMYRRELDRRQASATLTQEQAAA